MISSGLASEEIAKKYKEYFEDNEKKLLDDFFTFLKFESVSADPAYENQVLACCAFVKKKLEEMGLSVEEWNASKGYPCLFAEHIASEDKPTILFYHHYDVQPVDPLELWKSPPFEPEIRDGKIFARGTCDNKGQCFYSISAVKQFLDWGKKENLNIKILIEGEEEVGSGSLFELFDKKKDRFKADYGLLVDVGIPSLDMPAVTVGFRGIVTFDIDCVASNSDLHSGAMGGVAYNPLRALVELLAKAIDEKGEITIPGFYDGIETIDRKDLLEYDLSPTLKEFDIKATHKEEGYSSIESNWTRPTFEINGVHGGYGGAGFKTVIPAKANCKISCRLAPGQDPKKVGECVIKFLNENIKEGMDLKIRFDHGGKGYCTSAKGKLAQITKTAYEEVLQKKAGFIMCGGTLPISYDLAKAIDGETLGMGYALDTDLIHAPNEHFAVDRMKYGFMTIGLILETLAKQK